MNDSFPLSQLTRAAMALSLAFLYASENASAVTQTQRRTAAPVKSEAPASDSAVAEATCRGAYQRYAVPFSQLRSKLPLPAVSTVGKNDSLDQLARLSEENCTDQGKRKSVIKVLVDALGHHSGRIGVFLPLSGAKSSRSRAILSGMQIQFAEQNLNFDRLILPIDTARGLIQSERSLADLVFKEKIALVLTGLDTDVSAMLTKYSGQLAIPTVVLAPGQAPVGANGQVFHVFPQEETLAKAIARGILQRGIKRLAVLRPTSKKSDRVVALVRREVEAFGIKVNSEVPYLPGSFDSMDTAVRTLFKIDAPDRRAEFEEEIRKARLKAEANGEVFNPRLVSLKPMVEYDGIFMPDDFRTVRHFVKLFKFHGVQKMKLFGNHEWRSSGLIDPPESFLEGAQFADFIGSYQDLPAGIVEGHAASPYFADPAKVEDIDFKLIGYRAAMAIAPVLKGTIPSRRFLAKSLRGVVNPKKGYFAGTGLMFNDERQASWPSFVFRVSDGAIQPMNIAVPPTKGGDQDRGFTSSAERNTELKY